VSSLRLSYFERGDSFVGRLDPRTKLLYILWVFAMIMVFSHPLYQSFAMLTLAAAAWLGRLSLGSLLRAGRIGLYVGLASWALWIIFLSDEGRALFHLWRWPVTDLGVLVGLSVALRITSILFAFLIAAMTTPPRDLTTGLYQLRISVVFAMAVSIILRLIPQLQAEHAIIVEAQKSRAAEFEKGNLITQFRKRTAYIIPLALRSLKIVSDLGVAMESRAFDPYAKRTFVRESRLSLADKALLIAMVVTLVAGIGLRLAGLGGVAEGMLVGRGQ
jgi:energy-coupling factor transport system permease protein